MEKCDDGHPGNHSVEEQRYEDKNCNIAICFTADGFNNPARSKQDGNNRKGWGDNVEPAQIYVNVYCRYNPGRA